MTVKDQEVTIDHIEPFDSEHGFGWVHLSVRWQDPETGAWPATKVSVPVPYETSWSLDQVAARAGKEAVAALKHALLGLTAKSPELAYVKIPISQIVGRD